MKTLLLFLLALSAILAGAYLTSGRSPDAALLFASAFSASLITWTRQQYERKFYPLTRVRPLRLPLGGDRHAPPAPARRLAA